MSLGTNTGIGGGSVPATSGGNATVPANSPIQPPQAFVDAVIAILGSASLGYGFQLNYNSQIVTVNLPNLTNLNGPLLFGNNQIVTANFTNLTTLLEAIELNNNQIVNIDFNNLTTLFGQINLSYNQIVTPGFSSLTSLSGTLILSHNAMASSDVDSFLNSLAYTLTSASGTLDLNGNAAPTAASATARATLVALGLTIYTQEI